ncbi:MAG: hypothetical protein WA728_04355 [Xanthobacteraceae bacterium]
MLTRSLDQIDSATLQHYKQNPCAFVEQYLISPYDSQHYRLNDAERAFINHAFGLDTDGRLIYPLLVYGAIKKSRKTELAALITITMILLFGGRYAEGFVVANDKAQAVDRCWSGIKRICEATPLLAHEVTCTRDRITFPATQSTITAIPNDAAGLAGCHPTISVHDEMWCAPPGERGRAVFDQLIPTPSRKISCRLVVSHAGSAAADHLLYQLYQRGMQLPELGENLRGGSGMLMHWSHTPLHHWQSEAWLHMMRRELPPHKYTYMIENRFTTASASYINGPMFDRCVKESGPRPGNPMVPIFVGCDAAYKRDTAAIVAVTGEKDNIRLVYYKVFTPSPDDPLDFENTIEKTIIDLSKRYALRVCLVDNYQMVYMMQRLRRAGLKVEELTQSPANLTAMAQTLYDLFRSERFITYPDSKLRDAIIHTTFTETSGGLRFVKDPSTKNDLTIALAMACLACTERHQKSVDLLHRYRVYDPNFRDEDLPPLPPPEPPGPPGAGGDWWRGRSPTQPTSNANDRLRSAYRSLDLAFRYGLVR